MSEKKGWKKQQNDEHDHNNSEIEWTCVDMTWNIHQTMTRLTYYILLLLIKSYEQIC